jgi:hypothetical protein
MSTQKNCAWHYVNIVLYILGVVEGSLSVGVQKVPHEIERS